MGFLLWEWIWVWDKESVLCGGFGVWGEMVSGGIIGNRCGSGGSSESVSLSVVMRVGALDVWEVVLGWGCA